VVLPLPDLSNGLLSVGGSNAASIACNLSRPRHHRLSLRLTDYGHSRPPLCLRRPAADPCEIIVAADLPLPVAVHEVVPWQAPDRFDEMALQGAVLENAADMARAYPELWETPKAAEHDKARRTPPNSFIDTLLKTRFSGFFGTDEADPKFVHGFFGRRPWAWKKRSSCYTCWSMTPTGG
jgi:hypothetical protein